MRASYSQPTAIGVLLSLFGILFTILGIFLFFDRGFISIGNLMFLTGIVLVIGGQKIIAFLAQRRRWKGSLAFLGGIVLVIFGYTIIGIIIEAVGFFNLFG